jgi:hypothetical protein
MAKGKKGKRSSQPANANGMSRCWHVAVRNAPLNTFVLPGGNLLLCAPRTSLSSFRARFGTRHSVARQRTHTHTHHIPSTTSSFHTI